MHTIGKWTIQESQTKYIIETESNHVATTQTKANANLIAAAPELLKAVREITNIIVEHHKHNIGHKSEKDEAIIKIARTAISKAENNN